MNATQRIEEIGEKASDAEYKEQQGTDEFDRLLDLEDKVATIEESGTENKHGVNYLMAEVTALRAMVRELAHIIDETHVLSHEDRMNDLQDRMNWCTNEACQK